MKVSGGIIEFEQDTIIQDTINYSPTILAFIILALSRHKDKLDIIDFGGSLATNYFQNRKVLQHLEQTQFTWNVIERPVLAKLGREHLSNANLHFFSSLREAMNSSNGASDCFLFSGSLQYVAEPLVVLDEVIGLGAKLVALDRLLVSPEDGPQVFIQHPNPEMHYPATYPVWCFSKKAFIRNLVSKGFTLVDNFTHNPNAHFDHCGMIFVSR